MIIGRVSSHEALEEVLRPERARRRPPPDPAHRRDAALGGLAIGAPIAAALIGTAVADLLILGDSPVPAEGEGADGGASPALVVQDVGTPGAVRSATTAPLGSTGDSVSGAAGAVAGGEGALSSDALTEPFHGTAVVPTDIGDGGGVPSPAATAAPETGDAPAGDISVSFGNNLVLFDFGEDPSAGHGETGGEGLGPIGAYIVGADGGGVIMGTEGDDVIYGGDGDDVIHAVGGNNVIHGGAGNDTIHGGPGNDQLFGDEGDDVIHGGGGNNLLDGGPGNDQLFGGQGNDVLLGGPGDDLLDGGGGKNLLIGGSGTDTLVQNNIHDLAFGDDFGVLYDGANTLVIGAGFADTLPAGVTGATLLMSESLPAAGVAGLPEGVAAYTQLVDTSIQHITLHGTANLDIVGDSRDNRIIGNDGDNVIYGGGGNNWISGGGGNNTIYGGDGNDVLEGGPGDDRLFGGAGDDRLYGGDGNDVLSGGPGNNLLYGGAGDDIYIVGLHDGGVDTIFDHEGSNVIKIEGADSAKIAAAIVGEDLHLFADNNPLAIFSDYVGNEGALAGIDLGNGLVNVESLLVVNGANGPESGNSGAPPANDDLLADHLGGPTLEGTAGNDHLVGGDDGDWLAGYGGDDHLQGGAGNDVLDGGSGNNLLEGGAGDDLYLFRAGDDGFATIRDTQGVNHAELQGFINPDVRGVVIGNDLWVVVDYSPLFVVDDYANHPQAFAGVKVGDDFIPTEDLFG